LGGIAYWLFGYPLAFGKEGNGFMGWSYWAGSGLPDDELGHWFFDFVHAATATTLVSGALAERCNFYAYLAYSCAITGER
jgi:Amt family ammonium transporter